MRILSSIVLVFFTSHLLCLAFPADACAFQTRLQRRAKPEVVQEEEELTPGSYRACYRDGIQDAGATFSSGSSFAGGIALGALLGLIGTGIAWAASKDEVAVPPTSYGDLSGDCLQGFLDGYQEKAKSKKSAAAVGGGMVGTLLFVIVFLSATSN